jgi:DNA-binding MarR family transcriptional regulator
MASAEPLPFDPIAEARRQWIASGWEAAADGMAMVTSIIRVHQMLMVRIDRVLRPFGLSFARYEVLMLLQFSRAGELPLGKLGARLQVQPGAVTNVIDRLQADGLVARVPHPTDGRTTLASITPKGQRTVQKATAALNESVFEATGATPRSARTLFDALRDVRLAAGDFTE